MPEHQLKALYLYNFTKYMGWPTNAFSGTNTPFTIGLLCGPEIREDLLALTQSKEVNGRPVQVRTIDKPQDVESCQVVFLETPDKAQLAAVLKAARGMPVLTVGVSEEFLNLGGTMCLVRRNNRLRPRIDLEAARRIGLTVSAKLMTVAELANAKPDGGK